MKWIIGLVIGLLAGIVHGEDAAVKSEVSPQEKAEKSAEPAAELPVGQVTDQEWVKSHMGQKVVMQGVADARSVTAENGHCFYHFAGTKFVIFCHKLDAKDLPEEKKPESLRGKSIRVTGKLSMYREQAQIRIRDGKEIEVMP
jgi:hypothetical protein